MPEHLLELLAVELLMVELLADGGRRPLGPTTRHKLIFQGVNCLFDREFYLCAQLTSDAIEKCIRTGGYLSGCKWPSMGKKILSRFDKEEGFVKDKAGK